VALLHVSVRGHNDLISISDLEEAMERAFVKFADGTKLGGTGLPILGTRAGWRDGLAGAV